METSCALSLRCSGWTGTKAGAVRGVGRRCAAEVVVVRKMGFWDLGLRGGSGIRRRRLDGMSRSLCGGNGAIESENLNANTNEAYMLKIAAEDVEPLLYGRCIYLVGMMGSGKTTVGKIMAEALGYSFSDSDKLVELAVGGTSVAQIFTEHSEDFFRDNESKALKELSSMRELVVGTGGGAVIRPINWKYMKKGVTVWLDVPIEDLARRISAVGTASRPLLHEESGDAYSQALTRLTELFEERGESYSNADARVCLQHMAGKEDVNALTPTAIATEALIRIKEFLKTHTLEEVRMSTDEA